MHAILVTLCCCLPFGIVAIVYAAQVNSKFGVGDYAGAQVSSANAKKWFLIALISGLVVQVLWVIFYGLAAFNAYRQSGGM